MSDPAQDRFEALKTHFDNLSKSEQEHHADKGQAHDQAIFDMIKEGDGIGLYASVQKDPSLLERQDANGMTPLHWSSADRSGLTYEIASSQPSNAPWMRDNYDRLALDIAQEAQREKESIKIERITYPQLFKDETDGLVPQEKIKAFEKALAWSDTRPPFARGIKFHSVIPRLKDQARDKGELER